MVISSTKSVKSKVSGFALNPSGKNNFFNSVKLKDIIKNDFRKNIIKLDDLEKGKKIKPEIIFHLAAQSSVIESFKNSKNIIYTNILGTANILEVLKGTKE